MTITASSGAASRTLTLAVQPETSRPGVYWLAGSLDEDSTDSWKDGPTASARFASISMLSSDSAGSLYILEDTKNGKAIRKLANGMVSTLIRSGDEGTTWFGGSQLPAELNLQYLKSFLSDPAGNLYLVLTSPDSSNSRGAVYKVSQQGNLSLLAGNVNATGRALVDGIGAAATIAFPLLHGRDSAGNLHLIETSSAGKSLYRKLSPEGMVSTEAAPPARLPAKSERAELNGSVYIVAFQGQQVGRYTPGAGYDRVAGVPAQRGIVLGPLPGGLLFPRSIAALGNKALAVTSGKALLAVVPSPAPAPVPELQVDALFTETLAGGKPLTFSARAKGRVSWSMAAGSRQPRHPHRHRRQDGALHAASCRRGHRQHAHRYHGDLWRRQRAAAADGIPRSRRTGPVSAGRQP